MLINLVDHPDDVTVDILRRDDRDVFRVTVHAEDLGKVIGKGGQTARALRVLLLGRQRAHGPAHRARDRRVAMDAFVSIGEIVKAVGLKGEVKLYPLLDFHEPLLDSGFLVWQDGTPARLKQHRPSGGCVAVWPEGSDSRDRAEKLVGRELGFLRASYLDPGFPRPGGGLPFRYLGRRVVSPAGEVIGTVDEVRLAGGQLLLVMPDGPAGDPDPGGGADPAAGRRPRG